MTSKTIIHHCPSSSIIHDQPPLPTIVISLQHPPPITTSNSAPEPSIKAYQCISISISISSCLCRHQSWFTMMIIQQHHHDHIRVAIVVMVCWSWAVIAAGTGIRIIVITTPPLGDHANCWSSPPLSPPTSAYGLSAPSPSSLHPHHRHHHHHHHCHPHFPTTFVRGNSGILVLLVYHRWMLKVKDETWCWYWDT